MIKIANKYKNPQQRTRSIPLFLLKRIIFFNFLPKKQVMFYIFLKGMASFFTLIIMKIIKKGGVILLRLTSKICNVTVLVVFLSLSSGVAAKCRRCLF